ncbi:protein-disulfide reductase DsbD domain-containing protein [Cohaesibacter celericrescens]|uniref:protein-disulfide reductase DsbD domain-containing protein n=1 Tax=Cohaesibacter celericrescens TaxID=2067669 RepID=UPI0035636D98
MKHLNIFGNLLCRLCLWLSAAALLASIGPFSNAQAATSPWQETLGGKMRLIAGGSKGAHYKAGLEIVLDEGWKTYWKVPGDSGIPPTLDGTRSVNVAKMEILWPVPSRIAVGGTYILGYKDAIIFPLLITPKDPTQSVTLDLNTQIGLCSDLCVPLSADISLQIPPGGDRDLVTEMLIDRDLALAPTAASEAFGITNIKHQERDGQPDKLTIATKIPDGYGTKDLFVEGPENWFLPLSKPLLNEDGGLQVFELILDGLPKGGQSKGIKLTFTLTNGEEAVEQSIILEK